MDRSTSDSTGILDQAAIWLSSLCMLHCIALPFVLIAVPVFEQFAADHFHMQVLIFVIPVSIVAFGIGFKRHGHPGMFLSGIVGMALLVAGATWAHNEIGLVADRAMTIAGSLTLAAAHYLNSRLAKRHRRMASRA